MPMTQPLTPDRLSLNQRTLGPDTDLGAAVDAAAVLDYLRARFAKWQVPDKVLFVAALPLTPVGKVDKRALKARYGDVLSGDAPENVNQRRTRS